MKSELPEAIVFGNMAYPPDGGEPYEVDVSAIPQPCSLNGDPFTRALVR